MWVKATGVEPAEKVDPRDGGKLLVTFFDADRKMISEQIVGLWRGSFDWRRQSGLVNVPPAAKVGAVVVGLLGATGELCCDDIQVRPLEESTAAKSR